MASELLPIIQADAQRIPLATESVQCVVTSPPYLGLRKYGNCESVWGGELGCGHEWEEEYVKPGHSDDGITGSTLVGSKTTQAMSQREPITRSLCALCSAWRGELGHEPTPALFVEHLVAIFRDVHRVLRPDGCMFVVMGDSYAGGHVKPGGRKRQRAGKPGPNSTFTAPRMTQVDGCKPKNLIGVPWMFAKAMQQPYHTGPIKHEVDRAWLAGLIDADGCIGLRKQHPRPGRGTNPTFIPHTGVSSSDIVALERCQQITGLGNINLKHKAGSTDYRGINTRRDFYTWRLDGQIASRVIRDIYPYLVIKRAQATLAYNMNLSLRWGRPTRSRPVPPDVIEYREALYQCSKLANQRKPFEPPRLEPVEPAEEQGWWLRQDVIWSKTNPMPESVRDRTTRSHEYVFHFAKSAKYYYDADAVRQPLAFETIRGARGGYSANTTKGDTNPLNDRARKRADIINIAGSNLRSVWSIPTQGFPGAHFATFPRELARRCIVAGSAEQACPICGAPWRRVTKKTPMVVRSGPKAGSYGTRTTDGLSGTMLKPPSTTTVGFAPGCTCEGNDGSGKSIVLDPFAGSGTTVEVAWENRRFGVGVDLVWDYCKKHAVKRFRKGYAEGRQTVMEL